MAEPEEFQYLTYLLLAPIDSNGRCYFGLDNEEAVRDAVRRRVSDLDFETLVRAHRWALQSGMEVPDGGVDLLYEAIDNVLPHHRLTALLSLQGRPVLVTGDYVREFSYDMALFAALAATDLMVEPCAELDSLETDDDYPFVKTNPLALWLIEILMECDLPEKAKAHLLDMMRGHYDGDVELETKALSDRIYRRPDGC